MEYIRREGICELSNYPWKNKKHKRPLSIRGPKHYIDDWRTISEDEASLLAAVQSQPVTVSVPLSSGFMNYKEGLLDLQLAEETNNPSECPYDISKVKGHSLLIVGWGIFISDDPIANNPIRYWIVRNQWRPTWGKNGYGYVHWNSSALELRRQYENLTVEQQRDYGICFGGVAPLVNGHGYERSQQFRPLFQQPNTLDELRLMIEDDNNADMNYIVLFYKSGLENQCEFFDHVAKAYEHDSSEFTLVKMRLNPDMVREAKDRFHVTQDLTIMAYVAKPRRRCHLDFMKYAARPQRTQDRFKFEYVIRWLGEKVGGSLADFAG